MYSFFSFLPIHYINGIYLINNVFQYRSYTRVLISELRGTANVKELKLYNNTLIYINNKIHHSHYKFRSESKN